jgi:hypothetical protein
MQDVPALARTTPMIRLAAVAFVLLFARSAAAGPFGLERGMTLQQVGKAEKIGPGMYEVATVPKPHSAFESYIVQIGPTTGVCWIKAIGKTVQTGAYGTQLQTDFHGMKERLAGIYGVARVSDTLSEGSIWNEPRDWMMGLLKKERRLAALWSTDRNTAFPKAEFKTIGLFAVAIDDEQGFLTVEYAFSNEDACEAEIAKAEDSSL